MSKKRDRDGVHRRADRDGFFISYTDATGKRRLKKVHAANLREARKMRSGYIARVEKQKVLGVTDAEDTDFGQVTARYLKYQKPRVSEDTYERLEGIIEQHLKPALAGKIGAITRSKISDYVTDRLNEVSAGTVQKEFNAIKHIMRLAHEEWNLIPENPAKTLTMKTMSIKLPPGRVRYLHPNELIILLEHCPEWLRPIVILGIATGLRRGSIIELRWPQYYEGSRQLIIQKTKNGESVIVHLNEIGQLALHMAAEQFGRGPIGRIFPNITPNQVTVAFRRAASKAGIEDFHFHDLRHTNASWLRMTGTDIHTIAVMLGQKDIRMAMRYSHLSSDFLAANAKQLDGVFSSLLQLNSGSDATSELADRSPNVPGAQIVDAEIS
jgi:integrase